MVGLFVIISLISAVCQADIPVAPPVRCGYIPDTMYACIGNPKVVKDGVSRKCDKNLTECERMTCIFNQSGWLNGDHIDMQKLTAYFDQFAKDNPEWQLAVDNLKPNCINTDLPAQGIHLNCPSYDTMQCILASIIRNAQPSQWSSSPSCEYARQFAAACPICPSDCFSVLIPIGSCNACLSLPRSP